MAYAHLYEIVAHRTARYPDAIALGAQEGLGLETLTSRVLLQRVDQLAAELRALGVVEGDRVVTWLPSHWRTPTFLFALWKLGAVAVPFDREMNPEAGSRILASVQPRYVIAGFSERPTWAEGFEVLEWWEPRTSDASADGGAWQRPGEELAALFFTSGTTGNPKGCMITHANLCSQVEVASEILPLDPSCRLGSILPLSHLFEMTCGLLAPLAMGAAIHYIPSRRGPDIVRVLHDQRVSHMVAVPQLLTLMGNGLEQQLRAKIPAPIYAGMQALAERLPMPARRRLFGMVHRKLGGRLRMMVAGGAALPAETQHVWERLGVRVIQGYGASECSPIISAGNPDGSTPVGSVGKPIRGVEVKLSGEGELLVRGPNVMRGYWKDPERTAEVLDAGGWYATGDLADIDAEGNIRLSGRAKDLIVLPSGMNVWPEDLHEALRAQPAVQDAAVVLVPNERGGASLHAYLLPASPSDRETNPTSIAAAANKRLAVHQRIGSASWWPEPDFPRTSTLKVKRHQLPLPGAEAAAQAGAMPLDGDAVLEALAATTKLSAVKPDQTLSEVGVDSLGLVDLVLAIEEKTGRRVPEAAVNTGMTIDELRAVVAAAPSIDDQAEESTEPPPLPIPRWAYVQGRFLRPLLTLPFDIMYRVVIRKTVVLGTEHLRNLQGNVVFAGNHHSFADLSLVRVGIEQSPARHLARRLVVAALAEGLGWRQTLGKYAAFAFGLYPLDRQRHREASMRGLVAIARAGNAVLIFPQGTHTRPEEEVGDPPPIRFKTGVARIAETLDALVVPFGLTRTEVAMPAFLEEFKGLTIAGVPVTATRTPLAIAFGEPLRLEPGESPQHFAERLERISLKLARDAEAALDPRPLAAPATAS